MSAREGNGRFYNFPQPLALEAYEQAQERFATAVGAIPGVRSIYRFGTIGAPGISDLDFLVVIDESVQKQGAVLRDTIAGLDTPTRYLTAQHPQFFVTADVFQYYSLLRPTKQLTRVLGPALPFCESYTSDPLLNLVLCMELMVEYYPLTFINLLKGPTDVRRAAQALHSFSYTYETFALAFGAALPHAEDFFRRVAVFRQTLLRSSDTQELTATLQNLLAEGLDVHGEMIAFDAEDEVQRRLPSVELERFKHKRIGTRTFMAAFDLAVYRRFVHKSLRSRIGVACYPRWLYFPVALAKHAARQDCELPPLLRCRYSVLARYVRMFNELGLPANNHCIPYYLQGRLNQSPGAFAKNVLKNLCTLGTR